MTTQATTVEEYLSGLPAERVDAVLRLRTLARQALLPGFQETVGTVGINYVVPLGRYPAGYHCTPGDPLPFISLASQAKHIAVYHMGIYGSPELLAWFQEAWAASGAGKLDMGKSCIRFAKPEKIPFEVMGALFAKMSVDDWIAQYESLYRKSK